MGNKYVVIPSDPTKILGIYIDIGLTWNVHSKNILERLNKYFAALLQLRKLQKSLLEIYYDVVH